MSGDVDRSFWQELYKYRNGSGGDTISGWVNVLFPYLSNEGDNKNPWFDKDQQAQEIRAKPLDNFERLAVGSGESEAQLRARRSIPENKLNDFPCGLTSAPFNWHYLGERLEMSFIGGFFGVTQDDTLALRPQLGWAVIEGSLGDITEEDGAPTLMQEELAPPGYFFEKAQELRASRSGWRQSLAKIFQSSSYIASLDEEIRLLELEVQTCQARLRMVDRDAAGIQRTLDEASDLLSVRKMERSRLRG